MKTKILYYTFMSIMFVNTGFAQSNAPKETLGTPIALPSSDELNILIKFAPYIDIILMFITAYQLYLYFMDFQTDKAFLKMIPIAMLVFIAFNWRMVLGWFGEFGV